MGNPDRHHPKKPIFVAIEGLDGSGKSTLARRLAQHLDAEPLTTPMSTLPSEARQAAESMCADDPLARMLFYASTVAAASQHVRKTLAGGRSVIVDRYWLSTLTYHRVLGAPAWLSEVEASLVPATLVKLTRVLLLAPMVFGVGIAGRRRRAALRAGPIDASSGDEAEVAPEVHVPLVPLFVAGFLGAICLRATGWLSPEFLATAKDFEQIFLTAGMFGLGAGVVISRLRRLGGRPMVLGLVSWVLVAGAALVAAIAIS